MNKLLTIAFAGLVAAGCCETKTKIAMLPYPDTRRDSTVMDDLHGTTVADPYRWLENDAAPETADWVKAQNEVTFNYLDQIPYREAVRARLTELWNYPKNGAPKKVGEWYFTFKNDGLQNQSVLYRQSGLDGTAEVYLDPNALSTDGTVALTSVTYSKDDRWMAYSVAAAGSDWVKIHVRDIATGADTGEVIEWVKFSGAVWAADSKGFYYSRYEEPKQGVFSSKNEFQMVYYHALGTPQSDDVRVYRDDAHSLRYFHGLESRDGQWLFVEGSEGTSGTEMLYRRTNEKNFRVLFAGFRYDYSIVYAEDNQAWVYTNDGAPNFRLAKIDLANPTEKGLVDVIAENPDRKLEGVNTVGGYLMASYLVDATSKIMQHQMDGTFVREVELGALGTVYGFGGDKEETETFYSLTTHTAPTTTFRYDLASGTSTLYDRPQVAFNPDDFTTEQLFFTSKDGTRVPMFVTHRKGLKLNGKNPTYLYGYGGFNISVTPSFNPARIMFMEQGGVCVDVNLRGGGEYGERWHHGGMLANKQNVFDDFIGAAETLIAQKYTSPEKLAIAGGSNGGLLVGAAMTQRPDLFAVAIPAVGVLDMLRFHRFTVGWGWSVEYGNADDASQFEYLYKYSPLHNLKEGVCYPATMVTTGDHDDRVVPAHSFKFAAQLQHVQSCGRPTLIRIDTNAGHGAGKPTSKRIDEAADTWSFIFENTGTKVRF